MPFSKYRSIKLENILFSPPQPCLMPPLNGNPSEFLDETYPTKTRGMGLLYGENCMILIMSPLRWHIFICFMAKSAFGGVFRPQLRTKGSDPYRASMKYVVCLHLYIPWKFGERGSTPCGATGPSLSFFVCFLSVCLFVRHTTMLRTESLDGAYTHWTWGDRA